MQHDLVLPNPTEETAQLR
ncbi:hypothetical protein KIPB_013866, partial [Kipferlia bialata]|eukprot:g13866.t1